jgi:hypothetical protein
MPKKSFSVYLDEQRVAEAITGRVKRDHDGNFSAFMDALLQSALENSPPALKESAAIVDELARLYHPTLRADLQFEFAKRPGLKQDRIIALFLEALLAMLQRGGDPSTPFQLFDSEEQMRALFSKNPNALRVLQDYARTLQHRSEGGDFILNEDRPADAGPQVPNSPASQEIEAEKKHRAEPGERPGAHAKPHKNR